MKKVLFTATVDSHILAFHTPYLKYFKEQGYEVHVATNGTATIPYCDVRHRVSFERSPFKLNNLKAIRQLKKIIDTEQFEIIHTHTPMGSAVTRLAARNARRKLHTRVLYTVHGLHFYKGAPLRNWLIFYPIEKSLSRYTDTLITINQEDYQLASKRFGTKVAYVPGAGIDEKKFNFKMTQHAKSSLRKSLGLKDSDFVMIYPAELNKNKNQGMLIKAMDHLVKQHDNVHLLLPGQDSLDGRYQKLAKAKGLEKNIHFLGYRSDIPQLLKVSDLAVSTSLREGLPLNIIEAMYVGLPIVVTDCRGNRDLVNDSRNGYIVGLTDDKSLVEKIAVIAGDEVLAKQIGQANTVDCKKYFLDEVVPSVTKEYGQRIVIHLLSSNKFSGAENVVCELIRNTNKPYTAYYCSPSGDIDQSLQARSIRHITVKHLSYREINRVIMEYRPAVIHAHDFKASVLASLFHRKVSVVSHIHQNPSWLHKASLKSLIYRLRLNYFTKVVVVTDAVKQSNVFGSLPVSKLETVHNVIDRSSIIEKGGVGVHKKYDLGFCGRLEKVKQPLDFIRIVAELKQSQPNIKAVMVGDGTYRSKCLSLIKELELQDTIDLVGFKNNPYPLIRGCKFLMITSKNEGFGLVAVEATILDTLVLSYDLPSIREVLGSTNNLAYAKSVLDMKDAYLQYNNSTKLYGEQLAANQQNIRQFTMGAGVERPEPGVLYTASATGGVHYE